MMLWIGILVASVGCYLLKLAGLSLPQRVLDAPFARRAGVLLPIALLAALVAIQTFTNGQRLVVDARAAGLAAAVVALALRAPFLVVVITAAAVTAGLRALA
jgi:branched-subunit amino acid transport protein